MSKLNLLFYINAYSDRASSNDPSLNHFKWTRDVNGLSVENPTGSALSLAPGEVRSIFNGSRTLGQDGTTQYSIALATLSTNNYVLSWTGGTAPNFRTPRTTGADATTSVTTSINGTVVTFSSSAGTPFNLAGAQVGDNAVIGSEFNALNQGQFAIISLTATSFSIVNPMGVTETVALGSDFANQIQVFSAAGVQVSDTLVISGGFSPVTQGAYSIVNVTANTITFFSSAILPQESAIQTEAIVAYENAKRLVYIEADQECDIAINGASTDVVQPLIQCATVMRGLFLRTSTVWSLSITNNSTVPANVFVASVE